MHAGKEVVFIPQHAERRCPSHDVDIKQKYSENKKHIFQCKLWFYYGHNKVYP